jgi:AcrR family transcriptional regulator
MMEAVERHGYPATTLRELVALAGVSNTTFYEQFSSLEDCFLATYDAIVANATEQMKRAYASKSRFGLREQLQAALESYVDMLIERPAATYMVEVESLKLGAAGVAHRRRMSEAFEHMLRESATKAPELGEISDVTIRAIVGGIRGVVQPRVRSGGVEQLRDHIDELVDWGLSYPRPGRAEALRFPTGRAVRLTSKAGAYDTAEEVWDERPDSIQSRSTLTQRERIVRAAAMVAAEGGYGKLSIPAITRGAGVSNQTFYENFASVHETFLEALDVLGQRAVPRIAAAIGARDTWADAIVDGLEQLLTYLAENPLLARLPFIEAIGAGSEGLDRVWMLLNGLTDLFNLDAVPPAVGRPVPEIVVEAISAGIFVVIQHEVAEGRTEALPELLDEISFIALAPFGVE